jgi:hypothetical protein
LTASGGNGINHLIFCARRILGAREKPLMKAGGQWVERQRLMCFSSRWGRNVLSSGDLLAVPDIIRFKPFSRLFLSSRPRKSSEIRRYKSERNWFSSF